MSLEAQPEGQDPSTAVTGPWGNAVNQAFADDPVLAARVGQFMQTHYQPYVTRLENERNAASQAQNFYSAFQGDEAGAAFLSLAEEMFGPEGAEAVIQALGAEDETTEEVTPVPEHNQFAQLSPEDAELIAWAREQRDAQKVQAEQSSYEQLKAQYLAADEARKAIKPELFDPFVAANDGDFDKALEAYNTFTSNFAPSAPAAEAPATLPGGVPAPATEKRYTSFDDAWDGMMDEVRASRPAPPTV